MGQKVAVVNLSPLEREHLENLVSSGVESARKLTRARILLKADEQWTDQQIHQFIGKYFNSCTNTHSLCK